MVLSLGCASATYWKSETREVRHTMSSGQAVAYVCDGVKVPVNLESAVDSALSVAEEENIEVEKILQALALTQLPESEGLCIASRGGPISQELKAVLDAYLMGMGIGAVESIILD
jgi:hypothetical protein